MKKQIKLEKAIFEDYQEVYDLQIKSFKALLDKYQDYYYSPGAEKIDRTIQRFNDEIIDFWFITCSEKRIGVLRVCNLGELCKLKQISILPEYQGNGYAQNAIKYVEALYPMIIRWELDTILQEEKLCYLYEKMGYRKTGKIQIIKEGMDIVFYEKQL